MSKINIKLWKKISVISVILIFAISILFIVNYIQSNNIDPVNTELINTLVERLSKNPNDTQLREEIRALDLISRKAYFTNQWQIRTGAYFLLISVIIWIISTQLIKPNVKDNITMPSENYEDVLLSRKKTQKWISIGGAFIVISALSLAFVSHNNLKNTFEQASGNNMKDSVLKIDSSDNEILIAENQIISENDTNNISEIDSLNTDTTKEILSEFPTYKEISSNFGSFRGKGGNGVVYFKNVPTSWNGSTGKNILWKTKIPIHGYSSPIIWGDKLFVTGADKSKKRMVYCIDRHTGKFLWSKNVSGVSGSPAKSPEVTDDTGHAASTPATDGRRVYAIFSNGDIIALDMDGNKIWSRNLGVPSNHYGHSSSLIVFRNMLIVQYDHKKSAKLLTLSVKTGKTIWSTARKVKTSWASPIAVFTGKQTEIIVASDPFVASYNPWSGKENWKVNCIFGEVGPSPAYADGIVFVTNEYAKLAAIKLGEKPEVIWEDDEYLSDVPSPIATKKYLIQATSYGVVVCYDAKTGKVFWEKDFNEGIYSSPILIGSRIYLIDRKGTMHIFALSDKYSPIASPKLGESVVTTPAFVEGRIYIRGEKNLYCIGK